jgi:uncharacterized GH25 family protein
MLSIGFRFVWRAGTLLLRFRHFRHPWRSECSRFGLLLSALLGLAAPAAAHEFWIEPANFRPPVGKPVDVQLLVGQEFRGDTMIYLPESFERFVTVNARGTRNIPGLPGDDPAARLTPVEPGLLLIAYQSTRYSLDMDAPTFEKYLEKEGLDAIRAMRAQRSERAKPVREVYSRFAKSLLAVGGRDDGLDASRPIGLRLEIVPQTPIYQLKPGQALEVQLLYENRPLAHAQLLAFSKKKLKTQLKLRTDAHGRARFVLPHADIWMLSAVHMIPAPADAKADWESFWASLSFETGNRR